MTKMLQTLNLAALLIFSIDHGHCQEPPKLPSFDVTSVTPCKPGTPAPQWEHAGVAQFTSPGGRFTARATTIKFLLEWAYSLQPAQHTGGPSWLDTDRYDVLAEVEGNPTDDQMKLMTRSLLAGRFHLKAHREQRIMPVYVLTLGKTPPKLFPPKEGETHAIRAAPQMGADQRPTAFGIVATRFSLAQLSDTFARQFGRVVLNQTGLEGEYDFSLNLTPDDGAPNPMDQSHLLSALRDQLGLVVKGEKAPVEVLVIDSIDKVAAGN